jgi:hypothetical protein
VADRAPDGGTGTSRSTADQLPTLHGPSGRDGGGMIALAVAMVGVMVSIIAVLVGIYRMTK